MEGLGNAPEPSKGDGTVQAWGPYDSLEAFPRGVSLDFTGYRSWFPYPAYGKIPTPVAQTLLHLDGPENAQILAHLRMEIKAHLWTVKIFTKPAREDFQISDRMERWNEQVIWPLSHSQFLPTKV